MDTVTVCEERVDLNYSMPDNVHINLLVPSIPPTDTTTSTICKVEYTINVNKFYGISMRE